MRGEIVRSQTQYLTSHFLIPPQFPCVPVERMNRESGPLYASCRHVLIRNLITGDHLAMEVRPPQLGDGLGGRRREEFSIEEPSSSA